MVPKKSRKNIYMKCTRCGHEEKRNDIKDVKIVEKEKKDKGVFVFEKDKLELPITKKMCPKCENTRAYYFLRQTRAADEPPTQFFKCTKCGYVWREY